MSLFTIDLESLTILKVFYVLLASTGLGTVLVAVFQYTHRQILYDRGFSLTLLLLPIVISIIMLVSDNLARAFSLAGVFALVRFRTVIADSRDLTYILGAVGIGLANAMGYIGYAILVTVFLSLILLIYHRLKIGRQSKNVAKLKINIPENLNYVDVFNDIFNEYLLQHQLYKVKTTDFGTMYKLTYLVKLKPNIDEKEMIDFLRVRNGNLNISLTLRYEDSPSE